MAANTTPIVPISPIVGIGDTVATLTSRAKIVGTTGITAVTATSTNGLRIDQVVVQLAANSAAAIIFLWIYDGTNSFLFDEIPIAAVTASNTVPAAKVSRSYTNLVLPPTYRLYASTTIAQNTDVFALGGSY
jgi:hypothetical protein